MERTLKVFLRKLPYIIALLLFLMPFFWFKPGEMDLGGDSSRLFFYDPINYLYNHTLYGVSPSNTGGENLGYYFLPFNLILILLKLSLNNPTLFITLIHGINFSVAFISVYLIVYNIAKTSNVLRYSSHLIFASIFSGIFYVLSFNSIYGWDKVIITRNQFFLNPLIFLFLLMYFLREKFAYLLFALLTTLVFSFNFSYVGAPPFFAFYPLAIAFLLIFTFIVLKKKILWKQILFASALFIGLQSFHLVPQVYNIFSPGSVGYSNVFTVEGKLNRGLSYFVAISDGIKVSTSIFNLPQMSELNIIYSLSFILFVIIFVSFFLVKNKTQLLIGFFFLITLFFVSANITSAGFNLYKSLFFVPGFSMFRNFYGQWAFSYLFFYSLLLGVSLASILSKRKFAKAVIVICTIIFLAFFYNAIPLITGKLINPIIWQSKNFRIITQFDKDFEKSLEFVQSLPDDGRVLTLPLTDPGYQIVVGKNNGAYQGPSVIAYLTGKKDFAGIDELGKYGYPILNYIKNKEYDKAKELLGSLNIKYIFYNSDVRVYDSAFPKFPYTYVKDYMPKTQKEYKSFIDEFGVKEIFHSGTYHVYSIRNKYFFDEVYVSQKRMQITTNMDNAAYVSEFNLLKDHNSVYEVVSENTESNFVLNAEKIDIYKTIAKDFPISVLYPFAKWKTISPVYPIVMLKEEYRLRNAKSDPASYLELNYFSAGKRISELTRWEGEIRVKKNIKNPSDIRKSWKEPKITQFGFWGNVFTWEAYLERYFYYINESYKTILESNLGTVWKIEKFEQLRNQLVQNNSALNVIIENSSKGIDDKKYLRNLLGVNIDYYLNKIPNNQYSPAKLGYSLNMPNINEELDGFIYTPTIKNPLDLSELNTEYFMAPSKSKLLIPYGKIKLDQKNRFYLNIKPKNIHVENSWKRNDTNNPWNFITGEETENVELKANEPDSYGLMIENIPEDGHYLLSFNYNTNSSNVEFEFQTQLKKANQKVISSKVFGEEKNSSKNTKFNAVIQLKKDEVGMLSIKHNKGKDVAIVNIRNLSLSKLPQHHNIILARIKEFESGFIPKIRFKKINPTKYIITVSDANRPYNLVLLNAYSNNWKINIVDGEISWFQKFFQKSISENKHFVANGYANGWEIYPEYVGNKKDYVLSIELETQKYFYIGSLITIISTIILFILLVKELKLLKYAKKSNI